MPFQRGEIRISYQFTMTKLIYRLVRSAAGKILRRELRDRAKEELLHEAVKAKL